MKQKIKFLLKAYIIFGFVFTLQAQEIIKDIDGNEYKTITIGGRMSKLLWMAENLKTTKLNDGTPISLIENNDDWAGNTSPAYCWYDNDEDKYKNIYGALYNWYVVNTDKLCPTGWHVPSDHEWELLEQFVYGTANAGKHLKETGTKHWKKPNADATDRILFTALPGGFREIYGSYSMVRETGGWWTSTEAVEGTIWGYFLSYDNPSAFLFPEEKNRGLSVRCVKDESSIKSKN
ncbi:MAG: fibrobacter succinogenes major paralogous domain-containing protein [Bacteroidales bacterium]|nr:fibrobacter succinogenes major paralogous domain-containing protein [Bacteroidales bacterium]